MSSAKQHRKYDSGYQKRKKKQRIDELIESQKGAMERFIRKEPQVSHPGNQGQGSTQNTSVPNANEPNDGETQVENTIPTDEIEIENIEEVPNNGDNMDGTSTDVNLELDSSSHDANVDTSFSPDIFDPRYWDSLDPRQVDILAKKGPKRDLSIKKGPKDRYSRRWSARSYIRILPNGEKCNRDWLVYSKELDRVFCFSCKLFTNGHRKEKKEHWRKVLFRIVAIVKFLAKHSLAFRGHNSKLYDDSNGNFLGLIEMLAEFDPVIQEHVRRITNEETHVHYLGPRIQNELIHLLASAIKSETIEKIKNAKYFSVLLDCTPDASHQEQMSLIIRYVDLSSNDVKIEESFMGFLDVNDTTGQGLFDVLVSELKNLGLDIDDVRGQGYDNGSNMKGKNQGVQKKLLDVNPRAFYSACGCHSLNLTLCDMAKACAKDFFGIIQRIYTTFAKSTKKWQILKDNISGLTLKSVSATRWESRIESVKAIRFQCADIREALLQVSDIDNDPGSSSEAKGLANNELGEFEFIVAIVIWYEVLYAVNLVSKHLQAKDMLIDIAIEKVEGLISFFKNYRETGFLEALETAKGIALEMDIGTTFRKKRTSDDTNLATQSAEESFRISYFIPIVDQAIASLTRRFEQYQSYQKNFGFLFTSEALKSLDAKSLKSSCQNLEAILTKDGKSDIAASELYVELKFLQDFIPKDDMGPVEILKFLKRHDCFPNASIAYRIMLTIHLLKSYLRSTMTQERLNDLAMIALESDMLEKIDYERIVEDFISKNAQRIKFFK
ncbi:hypothetical protein PVAP13_5KG311521 [Panicum virgatum]|uniref:DUF4371 domain-containing protein n=1 Tax=Panicum virgatum TaxID=38727 RepID=A0A8T0SHR2_PANVG|nr:hypothetical protein PVAP13_5KG311521 [Panicum virgatum]